MHCTSLNRTFQTQFARYMSSLFFRKNIKNSLEFGKVNPAMLQAENCVFIDMLIRLMMS